MDLPGVSREAARPQPTALIVSGGAGDVDPYLAEVMRDLGYGCAILPLGSAETGAAMLGPFRFLLVGRATMSRSDAVEVIGRLRGLSPQALIVLIAADADLDVPTLHNALRVGARDIIDPSDRAQTTRRIGRLAHARAASVERVLAIGAHPDDVEIGSAGMLLEHRRNGDEITILTLSRGAVGGDTEARARESRSTAAAIGAQLLLADLPDASIDPGIDTIRLIEAVVAEVAPTLVLVHSKNDNHQDHRAVYTATMSATRQVPRVVAYQSPSATGAFTPTVFVPIDASMPAKVEVLSLFDSQNGRAYLEPDLVIAAARYWARQLGPLARYAEPFEVIRGVMNRQPAAWVLEPRPNERVAVATT